MPTFDVGANRFSHNRYSPNRQSTRGGHYRSARRRRRERAPPPPHRGDITFGANQAWSCGSTGLGLSRDELLRRFDASSANKPPTPLPSVLLGALQPFRVPNPSLSSTTPSTNQPTNPDFIDLTDEPSPDPIQSADTTSIPTISTPMCASAGISNRTSAKTPGGGVATLTSGGSSSTTSKAPATAQAASSSTTSQSNASSKRRASNDGNKRNDGGDDQDEDFTRYRDTTYFGEPSKSKLVPIVIENKIAKCLGDDPTTRLTLPIKIPMNFLSTEQPILDSRRMLRHPQRFVCTFIDVFLLAYFVKSRRTAHAPYIQLLSYEESDVVPWMSLSFLQIIAASADFVMYGGSCSYPTEESDWHDATEWLLQSAHRSQYAEDFSHLFYVDSTCMTQAAFRCRSMGSTLWNENLYDRCRERTAHLDWRRMYGEQLKPFDLCWNFHPERLYGYLKSVSHFENKPKAYIKLVNARRRWPSFSDSNSTETVTYPPTTAENVTFAVKVTVQRRTTIAAIQSEIRTRMMLHSHKSDEEKDKLLEERDRRGESKFYGDIATMVYDLLDDAYEHKPLKASGAKKAQRNKSKSSEETRISSSSSGSDADDVTLRQPPAINTNLLNSNSSQPAVNIVAGSTSEQNPPQSPPSRSTTQQFTQSGVQPVLAGQTMASVPTITAMASTADLKAVALSSLEALTQHQQQKPHVPQNLLPTLQNLLPPTQLPTVSGNTSAKHVQFQQPDVSPPDRSATSGMHLSDYEGTCQYAAKLLQRYPLASEAHSIHPERLQQMAAAFPTLSNEDELNRKAGTFLFVQMNAIVMAQINNITEIFKMPPSSSRARQQDIVNLEWFRLLTVAQQRNRWDCLEETIHVRVTDAAHKSYMAKRETLITAATAWVNKYLERVKRIREYDPSHPLPDDAMHLLRKVAFGSICGYTVYHGLAVVHPKHFHSILGTQDFDSIHKRQFDECVGTYRHWRSKNVIGKYGMRIKPYPIPFDFTADITTMYDKHAMRYTGVREKIQYLDEAAKRANAVFEAKQRQTAAPNLVQAQASTTAAASELFPVDHSVPDLPPVTATKRRRLNDGTAAPSALPLFGSSDSRPPPASAPPTPAVATATASLAMPSTAAVPQIATSSGATQPTPTLDINQLQALIGQSVATSVRAEMSRMAQTQNHAAGILDPQASFADKLQGEITVRAQMPKIVSDLKTFTARDTDRGERRFSLANTNCVKKQNGSFAVISAALVKPESVPQDLKHLSVLASLQYRTPRNTTATSLAQSRSIKDQCIDICQSLVFVPSFRCPWFRTSDSHLNPLRQCIERLCWMLVSVSCSEYTSLVCSGVRETEQWIVHCLMFLFLGFRHWLCL